MSIEAMAIILFNQKNTLTSIWLICVFHQCQFSNNIPLAIQKWAKMEALFLP